MPNKPSLRERAAAALDATHAIGERGPKTFQARARIAKALDAGKVPFVGDVTHLEALIAREEWIAKRKP